MATFRQAHVHMWDDTWFLSLEPLDKLLFIYLFSNTRAHTCGVYELAFPLLLLQTGIEAERARRGLATFEEAGRVYYDEGSGHCFVRNLMRYNGANTLTNRNMRANLRSYRQTEGASIRYWDLWAETYAREAEAVFGSPQKEKEQKEEAEQEEKKRDVAAANAPSVGAKGVFTTSAAASSSAAAGEPTPPAVEEALRLLEEARGEACNTLDRRRLLEMAGRAEAHRLTLGRGVPGADLGGMGWVGQAIEDANAARRPGNPLSLKFVGAVLDRWLAEGYRAPWGGRETPVFEEMEYWEEDL